MEIEKYGNGNGLDDLYILPESNYEAEKILTFLKSKSIRYDITVSDTKNQPWYGKRFILAHFAECFKTELEGIMK